MIGRLFHPAVYHAALVAGLLLCGGEARAQVRCPWLNLATASGLLGGPATLEMQTPAPTEAHCLFRRDDSALSLEIVVMSGQDVTRGIFPEQSTCTSPGTPVHAIGNEAILCAADRRSSRGDEVIGRVRDNIFRVVILSSVRHDVTVTRAILEQKTRDAAEQVAGALF